MPVEIWSAFDNAKLRYTLDYIFNERLDCAYVLNPEQHHPKACAIGYGIQKGNNVIIPDSGFLRPKGVSAQHIPVVTDRQNNVLIFPDPDSTDFSFDIFSAVFFMLSRYEEYTCQDRDEHGRFDLQHSLAFKHGFHLRAVVDEWIIMLRNRLLKHLPETSFSKDKPTFSLTVDVDMLFSYRTKGFVRNAAGWFRDISKGRLKEVWERPAVLFGLKKDPFDSFHIIDQISRESKVRVLLFILASQQRTAFDKNGDLSHPRSVEKLLKLAGESQIGLHPSYYCMKDDQKLMREKQWLSELINVPITASRRHFLRMTLPYSYRQLVRAGFTSDYTMGFASGHGFRAGTTRPFRFFDLETDQVLPLVVHPFCIMDGSLKDYQQMTLQQTEAELFKLADYIKSINGHFEMLLHNETLSESKRWTGWTDVIRHTIFRFQTSAE